MRALILLAFALTTGTAAAQSIVLQNYTPTLNDHGLNTVKGARAEDSLAFTLSFTSVYMRDPLVLLNDDGERVAAVVEDRVDVMAGFAMGLFWGLDVAVMVPYVPFQHQTAVWHRRRFIARDKITTGMTDPLLQVRLHLLNADDHFIDLALIPAFTIPLGRPTGYMGGGTSIFLGELAISRDFGPLKAAINVSYRLRHPGQMQGMHVHDELGWRAGVGYAFEVFGRERALTLSAEAFGQAQVAAPFATDRFTPTEILGSAKIRFGDFALSAALGTGILPGYGSPTARTIVGFAWAPREKPPAPLPVLPQDADLDGVLDDVDLCPKDPEDFDGFEDEDGCPELDNDADGVPDDQDRCPTLAEDIDGYEDDDGCPDLDHDGDGVTDDVDQCPTEPEDHDGYADDDGCEDPDNDEDTHPDHLDSCPNIAEDYDDFEDEDGCPDEDNDSDGIADSEDVCPDEPEVINDVEDDDGCPDEGESLVELTTDGISLDERIYFASQSHVIRERSYRLLNQVANLLKNHQTIGRLRIEGHTDDTGAAELNLKLSERRARSVRKYLIRRGVARDRLESEGFGNTRPRASNDSVRGRGVNRRVEFIIVEQD